MSARVFSFATAGLAAYALSASEAAASASAPQHMWTRVERVAVACSGRNIAPTTLLEAQLCARIAALARVRSPYPVVVGAGSLRDVTLRVERIGGQLTIRATRPAIEDEVDSSSAAVPIGLRLDGDGLGEGADAAIAAALDRVLPWRGQRASGTPPRS